MVVEGEGDDEQPEQVFATCRMVHLKVYHAEPYEMYLERHIASLQAGKNSGKVKRDLNHEHKSSKLTPPSPQLTGQGR